MLGVLLARDVADLGVPDGTIGDLLDEWRAGDVDLAADARVALDADDAIVGYAIVRRVGARAVVHPAHEGRGVGTHLRRWVERRAHEHGRELHRQWVGAANAGRGRCSPGRGTR